MHGIKGIKKNMDSTYTIETETARINGLDPLDQTGMTLRAHTFDKEVNHRPAIWQQVACNSVNSAKVCYLPLFGVLPPGAAYFFFRPPMLYWM